MEEIKHNPHLRERNTFRLDNDVSLGLSGTPGSLGYKIAEIDGKLHNSETIYGNNTYLTADLPAKFTVIGGDNAWGTEYMLYAGDNIESGSAVKKFNLNNLYVISVSAAGKISIVEFLYGTAGTAITPVVTNNGNDDFTLLGHGLVNGDKVVFNSVTTTTGLSANIVYYVVQVGTGGAGHFQVSLTSGGAAVVLGTGDGTCSISKLTQTSLTKTCISMDATAPNSVPFPILSSRITCNNRLFVRAKSESGQTISIGYLLGLHTYAG